MKERPLILYPHEVRSILDGRLTQLRRVVKSHYATAAARDCDIWKCPLGARGDRLRCRETWARNWNQLSDDRMDRSYVYRADGETRAQDNGCDLPWQSAIVMPRAASRITLELVEDARIELLQDISEDDAVACGFEALKSTPQLDRSATEYFRREWASTNGKRYPWDSNPWVWRCVVKRIKP